MSIIRKSKIVLGMALVVLTSGCGNWNSPTVPVSGTVTLDGKPLTRAIVNFTPTNGERQSTVNTDEQGGFESVSTFTHGDGVLPGEHEVTIIPLDPPPMDGGEENPGTRPGSSKPRYVPPFPTKYGNADKSGLKATVERGAKNEFTFELQSK